ncbi:MAG TPA: SOS response-associated peptidase [Mycobacteriales bacterium]|nr:SOS response-associated peptidase [Mycobacteriales bacterium]
MCGRYSASLSTADLASVFGISDDEIRTESLAPSWNVAPTDPVHVVVERHARDEAGEKTDDVRRQLRAMRWGLVPSWAQDLSIGARLINARAESVAEKPAFRRAISARRCLLPADGYYEWMKLADGRKQPFFIRRRDDVPVTFAGLYEIWRDPAEPADAPLLWTCSVITTDASPAVSEIHDRMPVLLSPESWERWLDPAYDDLAALRGLLVPAPADVLEAYPVSTAVSSVKNNGPQLREPVAAEVADETLF